MRDTHVWMLLLLLLLDVFLLLSYSAACSSHTQHFMLMRYITHTYTGTGRHMRFIYEKSNNFFCFFFASVDVLVGAAFVIFFCVNFYFIFLSCFGKKGKNFTFCVFFVEDESYWNFYLDAFYLWLWEGLVDVLWFLLNYGKFKFKIPGTFNWFLEYFV